eukprot:Gregarina_sp_Poly_1__2829@NODE_178_length_11948_cov_356_078613_g158_i0_p4_GENE_NODE_178_length_11948_cov_356_078613_g158_i0NODE_178_length_11948_cov_356_078613_g158_i0_p4_ORF_typecomplete_len323_score43_43FUSClike/PF12805_7/0_17_NODE_178_length_11948_cov_356_078613_g158_i08361804
MKEAPTEPAAISGQKVFEGIASDEAFATIAIKLRPGKATGALYNRHCRRAFKEDWKLQLGPELPAMQVLDLHTRWRDLMMVCRIPEHILTKTVAWGHTEWCSSLVRPEMKAHTFCGIRYVESKVRHTVGAFVSLASTAPIFSVSQVALVCLARDFNFVVMPMLILFVVIVELSVIAIVESRCFRYPFSVWQALIALDLTVKFVGAAYEFAAVVRVSEVDCSVEFTSEESTSFYGTDHSCLADMSRKAWLNVGSLFAGSLSFFVAACLWWVARRLRRMMQAEDAMSRILLSVERPGKVLSPKPVALWLVGSPPFRHQEDRPSR